MANSCTGVDPEYSVYVGNLNPSTTLSDMEDLIYELFLQAGPLDKVFIPYDKETGKHKGYGFVEFMHKESIQYSINLMNGICLLDRYLNVRTVNQRQQISSLLTNKTSPSLVSPVTTPGAAKAIEDNPFLSPAKPLAKITTLAPGSSGEAVTATSVSTGATQSISTPPSPAQLMQCATNVPTPLFPSTNTVPQQPSNPSPLLHVQQAQQPKLLPLNPFLDPGYSSAPPLNPFLDAGFSPALPLPPPPPPNPFLEDLRCLPPLPPPPLQMTPPLAPPVLFPPALPPPPQQTPPLAPPPIPLFPTPLNNSGSGFQSNSNSGAQPVPLFPDLSPSPFRPDSSSTTIQSDDSATSSVTNASLGLTFETAHLATSLQTPPSTPKHEANVSPSDAYSASMGDIDTEMDFDPMNGDGGSWLPYSGDHERLHKGRLHANDHPAWLKRETKAKLSWYHMDTLALHGLKKSINSRQL